MSTTFPYNPNLPVPRRIVVRATNWVGDAVMCLPALQALRQQYRDAHISILARQSVADVYAREGVADDILLYCASKGWRDLPGKLRTVADLRKRNFDTAVLLQNAFEAAALVWLAGIPRRIGYARDGRGFLLTDPIRVPAGKGRHQRFYYLDLLRNAGLLDQTGSSPAISMRAAVHAADEGRARFADLLGWRGPITGVSPGAAYGTAKRWMPERFADAAIQLGYPVAIFGSAGERELCERIASTVRQAGLPVHNFGGETELHEFIDLAAACSVYLTNDSGGMHVASALGVPTVAIFGATDPVATGPTGSLARVIREPVACSPCLLRECPIDHRCMTAIAATRVAAEAQQLLPENTTDR